MPAGYSGTPLVRKLGIKGGMRLLVIDEPKDYWELLGELPHGVRVGDGGEGDVDLIHVFVKERRDLEERLAGLKKRMRPSGMIWVSWPKRAAKVPTDVTEDVVRGVALAEGLVDVKVCAVDETWSGLKLVVRLRDRG